MCGVPSGESASVSDDWAVEQELGRVDGATFRVTWEL